jgi:hypothetical protein
MQIFFPPSFAMENPKEDRLSSPMNGKVICLLRLALSIYYIPFVDSQS